MKFTQSCILRIQMRWESRNEYFDGIILYFCKDRSIYLWRWICHDVVDLINWPHIDLLACQGFALYNDIIIQKEKVPENPSCKLCPLRPSKNMIIITDYTLSCNEDSNIFCWEQWYLPLPVLSGSPWTPWLQATYYEAWRRWRKVSPGGTPQMHEWRMPMNTHGTSRLPGSVQTLCQRSDCRSTGWSHHTGWCGCGRLSLWGNHAPLEALADGELPAYGGVSEIHRALPAGTGKRAAWLHCVPARKTTLIKRPLAGSHPSYDIQLRRLYGVFLRL